MTFMHMCAALVLYVLCYLSKTGVDIWYLPSINYLYQGPGQAKNTRRSLDIHSCMDKVWQGGVSPSEAEKSGLFKL